MFGTKGSRGSYFFGVVLRRQYVWKKLKRTIHILISHGKCNFKVVFSK